MRNLIIAIIFISFAASNLCLAESDKSIAFSTNNSAIVNGIGFIEIETIPFNIIAQSSDYSGFEISFPGANDGYINITVDGGLPPYSYYWSNGETTEDITGLSQGAYTVWVTDSNNEQLIEELVLISPTQQVINLIQGWSLISTNINPLSSSLTSVFSDVVTNITVVKDEYGNFYWPQYNVNFIGNMIPGEAYMVNMIASDQLIITGSQIQPETVVVECPVGWSFIGYIRNTPASVVQMMSPISSDIELIKNSVGEIYWPQLSFDNIGNMNPDEGYQIKMINARSLVYPPNDNSTTAQTCPYHLLDVDNNVYSVVQIGTQCWMKENLKVTHYSDGTPLVDGSGVGNINGDYTTKYYFNYNDSASNSDVYGKLYTWNAMMNNTTGSSSVQGVCPTGWHIPNNDEWTNLLGFVDSQYDANDSEWDNSGNVGYDAGGNLKESGIENWLTPNTGGTDLYGFKALPGGYRLLTGVYMHLGENAYFWVNQDQYTFYGWFRKLSFSNNLVSSGFYNKSNAMSVRCLKNL